MSDLISAIFDHPNTPPHLKKYLLEHESGQALFDVLYFIDVTQGTRADAAELHGFDGNVFRKLSDIVIHYLQDTTTYDALNERILELSDKLSDVKDENGYIDMVLFPKEQAEAWVEAFEEARRSGPRAIESGL